MPKKNSLSSNSLESKQDPDNALRILVAWSPTSADDDALDVAAWLSRTTKVRIRVVSTLIQPWGSASLSKLGGKYKKWFRGEASAVGDAVKNALVKVGVEKESWSKTVSVLTDGTSEAQVLTDAAEQFKADLILLTPSHSAPKSRIFAGSTADALLHYSPITLGLTPRGVKLSKSGVTRVNFAFTDGDRRHDDPALLAAAALASRFGVPLRILAFSPTGFDRATLNDKLDVAKELTGQWCEQSLSLLDLARDYIADIYPELEVSSQSGLGTGWGGAVDSLKWKKGDLLILGSHPLGPLARVFIGSTATEILPHLKVPVLVHPVQA